MTPTMTYEKLYSNMVKKFTVEKDNKDYTLGDYMLMKAQSKKNAMTTVNSSSSLTVAKENKKTAISAAFSYINDKLTVKEAPVRNKTMRSFPLRASFAALGSAFVMCALIVSCCFFGVNSIVSGKDNTVNTSESEIDGNVSTEESSMVGQISELF